ncbi:MAG: four helix bundle protein [Chloroflexi bacterium]|nr:four helix bundle protein [Chloroflexota bacterium]
MVKGDDIEDRLIDFAVRIVQVCDSLPDTAVGRHVRGQLLRCGTSPAPNYGEARSAESNKDFVHKLKVVLKGLNESRVLLKIIVRSGLLPADRLSHLQDECGQLCRIIGSSIQTLSSNTKR